jgi:N4-gp56 family major capsid protein
MTGATYGASGISPRTNVFAAADMLAHAEPVSVLAKFGMTKPLPQNKTDTIKFRRAVPLPALTAPLAEGVTPATGSMQYEDVSVQILQWGAVYGITDKIADTHEDPVLQDNAMLCGEQAQKTLEAIIWGKIKAGTTVYYANGTQRTDVNTTVSINDVRKVVRYLQAQKGKKLTTILSGDPAFNTSPIEAAYVGFTHTDMQADIRTLPGFVPVAEYGSQKSLVPEEFGTVEDVRFITSPELTSFPDAGAAANSLVLSTSGTNADIYPIVIVAKEAYGLVPLKGKGAITPRIIQPDTIDKSDPLGQRGYVGWKAYFNAIVLNQTWMGRIEAAASVLN